MESEAKERETEREQGWFRPCVPALPRHVHPSPHPDKLLFLSASTWRHGVVLRRGRAPPWTTSSALRLPFASSRQPPILVLAHPAPPAPWKAHAHREIFASRVHRPARPGQLAARRGDSAFRASFLHPTESDRVAGVHALEIVKRGSRDSPDSIASLPVGVRLQSPEASSLARASPRRKNPANFAERVRSASLRSYQARWYRRFPASSAR